MTEKKKRGLLSWLGFGDDDQKAPVEKQEIEESALEQEAVEQELAQQELVDELKEEVSEVEEAAQNSIEEETVVDNADLAEAEAE
ncbi:signal recognition particle-docking protein FtsY, partial [Vibrionales bacterium C3R12]